MGNTLFQNSQYASAVLLVVGSIGMVADKPSTFMMTPRGIRNCNPLNIRRSADKWKGLKTQQTDTAFCQFENMEWGWRAAFCVLTRTYYSNYRLNTIRSIIGRWAPPSENNTQAYIDHVCRLTGIGPDEPLGIPDNQPARWMSVAAAMAIHENGTPAIDYFALLRGWQLCRGNL